MAYDANDWVNPYLSDRRQYICRQLAQALPNTVTKLSSHDGTAAKFTEWTGHTQRSLETAWQNEGFAKNEKGQWARDGVGAVTTSCEGLVGTIFTRIEQAKMGKRKGGATSFSLSGNDKWGREKETPPVGWHWFRERSASVHPRAGDVFQIGTETRPHQWTHHHVGVITQWSNDDPLMWETVEAGQGGPGRGYDFMIRKEYRLVNPIDNKAPRKVIMGWLDIDEHFG
ncbi:hypothetical protein EOD42_13815 [Rhodovarius crocodyli]|uniref:CHAP domain-containing protein n=1 Tax=Rhodovarius crocodyli TaxID=1979269 RepID=A0A437MEV1_9PROT|nr:hypothetical protein [Rhodovarius crocodyli]RVT96190.1 hypothetical protein EOD42_13815 [Rhodovarius crocodyli]